MSARKWPIYSMPVGGTFVLERAKLSLRCNLHQRANRRGIRLRIERVQKYDAESPVVVRRVA